MFGSRKGFQARPPPPRPRKPAPPPPPKKQLFAFDPVAAHYNALNHERRFGVTQPVVCVDLNAANELRRWRETGDLTEAAATIKALVPEAANEGELLERALADLDVKIAEERSHEERIQQLIAEAERLRTESEAVHSELHKALSSLDIVTEENLSLSEQIQRLAGKASERDALASDKERLSEQATILPFATC